MPDSLNQTQWSRFVAEVKKKSPPLAALLTVSRPKLDQSEIVLEVAHQFHHSQLSTGKMSAVLRNLYQDFFGKPLIYRVVVQPALLETDEKLLELAKESLI